MSEKDVVKIGVGDSTKEKGLTVAELNLQYSQNDDNTLISINEKVVHPEATMPWIFLEDSYSGSGGFIGCSNTNNPSKRSQVAGENQNENYTYLTKFPDETYYSNRLDKAVYQNTLHEITKELYEPIFSNTLKIQTELDGKPFEDKGLNSFVENVNGYGWSYNEFKKNLNKQAIKLGFSIAILKKENNGQIYLVNKNWGDILDYKLSGRKIESISFSLSCNELSDIFGDERQEIQKKYKKIRQVYYMLDGQVIYEIRAKKTANSKAYTIIESYPLGLSYLPVKFFYFDPPEKEGKLWKERPISYQIAMVLWQIWNRSSIKDYILDKQGFDILFVPPGIQGKVIAGEGVVAPAGSDQAYTVSPDADKPRIHMENIEALRNQLKEKLHVFGVSLIPIQEVPESGVARAYKFQAKNQTLQALTTYNKEFDTWFYDTTNDYLNRDNTVYSISISYKDNYSPESPCTVEELKMDYLFYKSSRLYLLAKETLKEIVRKRFSEKLSADRIDQAYQEIDNINMNEEDLYNENRFE